MKWLVIAIALAGCGGKKETKPEDPPVEKAPKDDDKDKDEDKDSDEGGMLGSITDRVKSKATSAGRKAKEVGGDVADRVKDEATSAGRKAEEMAVEKAKSLAEKAGELSAEAIAAGGLLKGDLLGKLAFVKNHFDLTIDSMPESESDYRARISGMKQIKVGDYTVGFAQESKHPLGTVYKWQFRISWRVPLTGRAIRLAFFTNDELEDLEDAATLLTIISAVDRLNLASK